jgi:hypothetical protein
VDAVYCVRMPLWPHTHHLRRRGSRVGPPADQVFLLQRVQPALSGLMDGSLSTLAPIFAVVLATHQPRTAFFTGLATALGAGVSMAFSEGLSDTGDVTGRGNPFVRGGITGCGTFIGGFPHAAVPHRELQRRDTRGGRRGGRGAGCARRAALDLLPHELRELIRFRHARWRDHRRSEFSARDRRRLMRSLAGFARRPRR